MDILTSDNSSAPPSDEAVSSNSVMTKTTSDYEQQHEQYVQTFTTWSEHEQVCFVENLLKQMQSHQHGQVNLFLLPMLKRDFVGRLASYGLEHVAEKILAYLDDRSLKSTELVCREWYHVASEGE